MFDGVYTALVTPFQEDGSLHEEDLRKLVDFQIREGVQGLVPMGTTGESPTLSHEEHVRIIEIVVDEAAGRVPVIAGAGSNSTDEAIRLSRKANELGASATLQVSPYYNKPTQEGLYRHFWQIAEQVELPLIVYNIPGRSAVNVSNETMLRLAQHGNIAGVKEATGNLAQAMEFMMSKPADFVVLSGDDNMTYPLLCLGGRGVISVASNVIPRRMASFVSSALQGDFDGARARHFELLPLFKALFLETNPIPIKAALAMKGMLSELYRLPMCPLSSEHRKQLEQILRETKVL